MVAPALIAGIGAAGLAAGGGVAGQSQRKYPRRQLEVDPWSRQQMANQYLQAQRAGMGMGPSYAELQMRRAGEQARAQASSQAASARGSNLALAQRTGAQNQAAIGADIAGQAGLARMEEILAARQMAAQQAAGLRQTDMAEAQANLAAQQERDRMEFARRQRNKDRLYGALTMGAASIGRLGAGGGGGAGS